MCLTVTYLSDVFDTLLLQQPLVKPLGLFWGHFGLISGEEANLVCVTPLAMGQGTEGGMKRQYHYGRLRWDLTATEELQVSCESSFVILSEGLTCGWSVPVWGSSRKWRAGWYAEYRPGAESHRSTWFSGKLARLGRPFSPDKDMNSEASQCYTHAPTNSSVIPVWISFVAKPVKLPYTCGGFMTI